jgi:transposase
MMRGRMDGQSEVFHTFHIDDVVPAEHPLRSIKPRVDGILKEMSHKFGHAYGRTGRPSIPPEQLIKALLLQAVYSIRSEIQLCEQIGYNLLFRWFLDLNPSAPMWTPEVFSMNRKRFDNHGFVRDFFERVVKEAIVEGLVSHEHFSVDGTLIQSFASMKSVRPIDSKDEKVSDDSDDGDKGNPTVNFRNEKRTNATHRSIVDPDARLARKGAGKPALLAHSGHVLMENRNGLSLDIDVDQADGHAERRAAKRMLNRAWRNYRLEPSTLSADKGYADGEFLRDIEDRGVKPHVSMPDAPIRAQDENGQARQRMQRRMRTKGYQISQRVRKRIEEVIGWCKQVGGLVRARFIQRWKIVQQAECTAAAYNLLRMARLRPLT